MILVFSMRFVFDFNPAYHLLLSIFFFLFQWEFYSQDKNHNDILDEDEIESMIDRDEDCMVGFMKSCDYDHQKGISIREWNTCFPPVAAGEYIRAKGGKIADRSDWFARFCPVSLVIIKRSKRKL